ncbi:MAG: DinB family protein [Ginsengibacter sp.]
MIYNLEQSIEILTATPRVLNAMLQNLSQEWTTVNEGGDTWSAYDILGHLIYGEKTDWVPRMRIILSSSDDKAFKSLDRFAQFEESKGKTLLQLLEEFSQLRQKNIQYLMSQNLSATDFERISLHPVFGNVSLSQLLATWTVHDLNHIAQLARVMAKQYKAAVGPWIEYLGILRR